MLLMFVAAPHTCVTTQCSGGRRHPRGTTVLVICDLEGLPEGNVVTSYKWYNNCTTGQCEIQGVYCTL